MSRKIILIKQELLLLVYELNRSGLLAENEKIRPILAQLEKLLLCDLSPKWYRYAPSYVSPAYHLLEGFPFIQEPPSGDLQERVLIRHHDYDQCFQSVQLLQWNSQVKFNVTVYRNLPTTRDSIMTS